MFWGEISQNHIVTSHSKIYNTIDVYCAFNGDLIATRHNKNGFLFASSSDKYAILLYSGKSIAENKDDFRYANIILTYDWNGNPYKYFTLDHDFCYINYDAKRNVLYGIAMNPEATLVEYNMNNILE